MTELSCFADQRSFRPVNTGAMPDIPMVTVLLVRSGGFLLRSNGREEFIDPTMGFVLRQRDDTAVSHPAHTFDVSTVLEIRQDIFSDGPGLGESSGMPVAAGLDLAHRTLVAACRAGVDQFEVSERVHALLARVPDGHRPAPTGGRASTLLARRRMVDQVRTALIDGPLTVGLEELSSQAACSPAHLSRVFHQVTGQTLTSYRNQLRVRAVAEEIAEGQSLRGLASKYGFADQAHMTRVFRRHAGEVPTRVRALLRPAGAGGGK
ncbi:helix-turn-helix domain-containing protein [Streptomyces abikoensis]|uniref:helix-turn-helix domain-containing protein n=1 Tax=Streptomyces abikoensis TaxID=97398 RepID=UPI0033FDB821